jgi:hypothetical protein
MMKQMSVARTTKPVKPVTIADRVEIGLSVLSPDERVEVHKSDSLMESTLGVVENSRHHRNVRNSPNRGYFAKPLHRVPYHTARGGSPRSCQQVYSIQLKVDNFIAPRRLIKPAGNKKTTSGQPGRSGASRKKKP